MKGGCLKYDPIVAYTPDKKESFPSNCPRLGIAQRSATSHELIIEAYKVSRFVSVSQENHARSVSSNSMGRGAPDDVGVSLSSLKFSNMSHFGDTVTSIESGSDLLIGHDETLELNIQVLVLALKHMAVRVERVDFRLDVIVSLEHIIVVEAHIILLLAAHIQLIVGSTESVLALERLRVHVSVAHVLILSVSRQITLVRKLTVEVALQGGHLGVKPRVVVLGARQLGAGRVEGLARSAKLKLLRIGKLAELVGTLLRLEQIVVDSLDAGVVVLALALLESNGVSHSVDLVLILGLLLAESTQLERQIISILTQGISLVTLDGDFSLKSDALLLTAANLIANSTNLSLQLVVTAVLLVEKETKVLHFLAQSIGSEHVLVVTIVVVVILHVLLVLQVAILLLNSIELVAKCKVILVSLLDLEYLCLKLRDEQILLIAGKVHRVVVLYKRYESVDRFKAGVRLKKTSNF